MRVDNRPSIFSCSNNSRSTAFGSSISNMSAAQSIFKSGSILTALNNSRVAAVELDMTQVAERDDLSDDEDEFEPDLERADETEGIS